MALYEQPNFTAGIDGTLVTTSQSVPVFPVMILFFIFFVVLLGGSLTQRRRQGSSDVPFWAALAGLTTTVTAVSMTLAQGMINLLVLGIVIAVTIMCGLWFFLSKSRGEF